MSLMNHRFRAAVAMSAIIAATGPALAKAPMRGKAVPAARAALAQPAATKPALGSFGIDLAAIDKSVRPGDNFYAYVNGNWDKRTPIPDDKASWGAFNELRDLSDSRTRDLLAAAAPGSKMATLYRDFMDEAAIEAKGYQPIVPELTAIRHIDSYGALAATFARGLRTGGATGPIALGVGQDLKNNTQYVPYIVQSGLGMPDRDYYLSDSPKFVAARAKYVAYIAQMLRLANQPDPDGAAQRIMALETNIAKAHLPRAERRQVDKMYNPYVAADIGTAMPGFEWAAFLTEAKVAGQPKLIVREKAAVTALAAMIPTVPLATWQDYLAFRTISGSASMLSRPFVDANFAFYGTTLTDTPRLKDRWKRGVDFVNGAVGEDVGQAYVAKYFTPDAKAKMDDLVHNIIATYDTRLAVLPWMDPATRAKARIKLAAFTPKIGYPTKWRDYSSLTVTLGDLLGNARRADAFEYDRDLGKIGKPVDRTEWGMTPQTVNAYANPAMNEIVFPAAILQPPFFDAAADPAVNYGAIGAVIGHELSHHFDDQGRKFDAAGNLSDWWTPQDIARFKVLTDQVVKQYGSYEGLPGLHVNGELTLGENIADLAGLTVAYDAYHRSLGGKRAPVIGGYTGDQRFFMGFGQVWRQKSRAAALQQQITTDPHSPGFLRPNVVRNLNPWYPAFTVRSGEKLYLPPADRIKVW